jgi:hypothetical protein
MRVSRCIRQAHSWPWLAHRTRIINPDVLNARSRALCLLSASVSKGDLNKVGEWWECLSKVSAASGESIQTLHSAGLEVVLQTHLFAGEQWIFQCFVLDWIYFYTFFKYFFSFKKHFFFKNLFNGAPIIRISKSNQCIEQNSRGRHC